MCSVLWYMCVRSDSSSTDNCSIAFAWWDSAVRVIDLRWWVVKVSFSRPISCAEELSYQHKRPSLLSPICQNLCVSLLLAFASLLLQTDWALVCVYVACVYFQTHDQTMHYAESYFTILNHYRSSSSSSQSSSRLINTQCKIIQLYTCVSVSISKYDKAQCFFLRTITTTLTMSNGNTIRAARILSHHMLLSLRRIPLSLLSVIMNPQLPTQVQTTDFTCNNQTNVSRRP